jgi:hypothetical protein
VAARACLCVSQVRDIQNSFFLGLTSSAPAFLERYGAASDNPELDAMPEEVQLMLWDKDTLLNAIQVRTSVGQYCGAPGALAGRCGPYHSLKKAVYTLRDVVQQRLYHYDLAGTLPNHPDGALTKTPSAVFVLVCCAVLCCRHHMRCTLPGLMHWRTGWWARRSLQQTHSQTRTTHGRSSDTGAQ